MTWDAVASFLQCRRARVLVGRYLAKQRSGQIAQARYRNRGADRRSRLYRATGCEPDRRGGKRAAQTHDRRYLGKSETAGHNRRYGKVEALGAQVHGAGCNQVVLCRFDRGVVFGFEDAVLYRHAYCNALDLGVRVGFLERVGGAEYAGDDSLVHVDSDVVDAVRSDPQANIAIEGTQNRGKGVAAAAHIEIDIGTAPGNQLRLAEPGKHFAQVDAGAVEA